MSFQGLQSSRESRKTENPNSNSVSPRASMSNQNTNSNHIRFHGAGLSTIPPLLTATSAIPCTSPTIISLDLSNNLINSACSQNLLDLQYLQRLNLSQNQITQIEDFSSLRLLEYLNLSHNLIEKPNLHRLHLNTNLRQLDLSYNQIRVKPSFEKILPFLSSFDLRGNPLTSFASSSASSLRPSRQSSSSSNISSNQIQIINQNKLSTSALSNSRCINPCNNSILQSNTSCCHNNNSITNICNLNQNYFNPSNITTQPQKSSQKSLAIQTALLNDLDIYFTQASNSNQKAPIPQKISAQKQLQSNQLLIQQEQQQSNTQSNSGSLSISLSSPPSCQKIKPTPSTTNINQIPSSIPLDIFSCRSIMCSNRIEELELELEETRNQLEQASQKLKQIPLIVHEEDLFYLLQDSLLESEKLSATILETRSIFQESISNVLRSLSCSFPSNEQRSSHQNNNNFLNSSINMSTSSTPHLGFLNEIIRHQAKSLESLLTQSHEQQKTHTQFLTQIQEKTLPSMRLTAKSDAITQTSIELLQSAAQHFLLISSPPKKQIRTEQQQLLQSQQQPQYLYTFSQRFSSFTKKSQPPRVESNVKSIGNPASSPNHIPQESNETAVPDTQKLNHTSPAKVIPLFDVSPFKVEEQKNELQPIHHISKSFNGHLQKQTTYATATVTASISATNSSLAYQIQQTTQPKCGATQTETSKSQPSKQQPSVSQNNNNNNNSSQNQTNINCSYQNTGKKQLGLPGKNSSQIDSLLQYKKPYIKHIKTDSAQIQFINTAASSQHTPASAVTSATTTVNYSTSTTNLSNKFTSIASPINHNTTKSSCSNTSSSCRNSSNKIAGGSSTVCTAGKENQQLYFNSQRSLQQKIKESLLKQQKSISQQQNISGQSQSSRSTPRQL